MKQDPQIGYEVLIRIIHKKKHRWHQTQLPAVVRGQSPRVHTSGHQVFSVTQFYQNNLIHAENMKKFALTHFIFRQTASSNLTNNAFHPNMN